MASKNVILVIVLYKEIYFKRLNLKHRSLFPETSYTAAEARVDSHQVTYELAITEDVSEESEPDMISEPQQPSFNTSARTPSGHNNAKKFAAVPNQKPGYLLRGKVNASMSSEYAPACDVDIIPSGLNHIQAQIYILYGYTGMGILRLMSPYNVYLRDNAMWKFPTLCIQWQYKWLFNCICNKENTY